MAIYIFTFIGGRCVYVCALEVLGLFYFMAIFFMSITYASPADFQSNLLE